MTNIAIRWSGLLLIVGAVFLGVAIVTASLYAGTEPAVTPVN
jgi:hypothetical protein